MIDDICGAKHLSENEENVDRPKFVGLEKTKNDDHFEKFSSADVIDVQHECFGRALGQLYPKLYVSPGSKCIKCAECCK